MTQFLPARFLLATLFCPGNATPADQFHALGRVNLSANGGNILLDVYIRSGMSNNKRTMRTVDLADKRFNNISSSLDPRPWWSSSGI
jgi:hypothetical protein